MAVGEPRTSIEKAAQTLRKIVLDLPPDSLIGSEEALIAQMGCSRSTVRQVARLLEREGLLKVRRGINGGYFGARPTAGTIEQTVSSYLELLDTDARDVMIVGAVLWVEVVRKAANADPQLAAAMATRLNSKVKALKDSATFEQVRNLELAIQQEIFQLVRADYVKLIFDINVAYSRRRFSDPIIYDDRENLRQFVRAWKESKALELAAIERGDPEMAVIAARFSRKIWQGQVATRFAI